MKGFSFAFAKVRVQDSKESLPKHSRLKFLSYQSVKGQQNHAIFQFVDRYYKFDYKFNSMEVRSRIPKYYSEVLL